jgi:hypothetical protein
LVQEEFRTCRETLAMALSTLATLASGLRLPEAPGLGIISETTEVKLLQVQAVLDDVTVGFGLAPPNEDGILSKLKRLSCPRDEKHEPLLGLLNTVLSYVVSAADIIRAESADHMVTMLADMLARSAFVSEVQLNDRILVQRSAVNAPWKVVMSVCLRDLRAT